MAKRRIYDPTNYRVGLTKTEIDFLDSVDKTTNGRPKKTGRTLKEQVWFNGEIDHLIAGLQGMKLKGMTTVEEEEVYDDFGGVGSIYFATGHRELTEDEKALVDIIQAKFDKAHQDKIDRERQKKEEMFHKLKEELGL